MDIRIIRRYVMKDVATDWGFWSLVVAVIGIIIGDGGIIKLRVYLKKTLDKAVSVCYNHSDNKEAGGVLPPSPPFLQ